jgi:N-acetylmuramoyl-L-alanine amidase
MLVSQLKFRNAVFVVGIAILQVTSAWAGNSHSPKDLYFLAQKSYYQLKGSPDKQKFRHHWENVIQDFSKVVQRYPKSPQAYKAVFTMARLYEGLNGVSKNSKDLKKALHYYKKVSQDFSPGALTDDALFESAEIYRNIKDYSSATGVFKKIFEKYPNGDQANKARQQYQRLASFLPNTKTDEKVVTSRPAKKQAPALKHKKKSAPEAVKQARATLPEKMKPVVLKQEKKSVIVKQVKLAPPASKKPVVLKKKKKSIIVKQAKLAPPASKKPVVLEKKKKSVVVKQAKLAPPAKKKPVKRTILGKGKRGYLYAPSSGKKERRALIVVDAGHGGKDQGAKSAKGIHEKDVNLTIARHVKTILVNRFKYRVVMTRKNDTFIPLKERSAIANNRNADLFVSIHANAAKRKSAHGIETYFLGTSNNDRALATAARENGELVHSVKDDKVQEILASLITTTKINDSSRLAGTVQENLIKSSRKKFRDLKNLGVKEGPFYVLHGADMPSILVEVGFLTNRKEARMLSKPDYLYRLASSIAEGIHKYLQDKGPSI